MPNVRVPRINLFPKIGDKVVGNQTYSVATGGKIPPVAFTIFN